MDITWNSIPSSTLDGVVFTNPVRNLIGAHRGSFLNIPGRLSSWYFPEVRGRRTVTVAGFFQAGTWPTGRRDNFEALADWLDVEVEAPLILGDDPNYYYDAIFTDGGDMTEWRELGTFELVWEVGPYAWELLPYDAWFPVNVDFDDTWTVDLQVNTEPIFVVTPNNGTITEFQWNINGNGLTWGGLLAMGQSLVINSVTQTITQEVYSDSMLTGAFNQSQLSMSGMAGVFPILVPGDNTIDWLLGGGTATDVRLDIHYRKGHRR